MKSEHVLFGTYDELKEWYEGLNIKPRGEFNQPLGEFKPFDEQILPIEPGKVKAIGWFEQTFKEADENNIPEMRLTFQYEKVCITYEEVNNE